MKTRRAGTRGSDQWRGIAPGCLVCVAVLSAFARAVPNDPYFDLQWGLRNVGQTVEGRPGVAEADIRALGAWEIHPGTSSVVVAIVGRGIDPHPEFADRLLEGRAMVGDLFNTLDTCPHDTHLAGIVAAAADNGEGIAGINGRAYLLPVRVFNGCTGTPAAVAEGIVWAVDHGADVVLVAIQFVRPDAALETAVTYAVTNDVVVVAPAGSAGNNTVAFPAAFEGCLAVSATTNRDTLSSASNYGPQVDLAAPGRFIWSTWTDGGYAYQRPERDTASASAFVAGVAALLRSYAPQISASDVARTLMESADDLGAAGRDIYFGAGRVNARRALETTTAPALRIEHVEPLPTTLPPDARSSFFVRIVGVAQAVSPGSATLLSRTEHGPFPPVPLIPTGADLFRVELPAVACGATLEYLLTAAGDRGAVVTDPFDADGALYQAYAVHTDILFEDDFEEDRAWQVQGGDNGSGRWSRVIPVGTSAQPGFDYSPDAGQYCYVTGQHFGGNDGTNDVDGGPVRLTSPAIKLAAPDVRISYARWFFSSGPDGEDVLTVELSCDGGATWVPVETVNTTGEWVWHSFRLGDFQKEIGDELRVRFSTADVGAPSLTEAAIDEFRVQAIRCSITPGDADYDGLIGGTDFGEMLGCWTGPDRRLLDGACDALDFDHNHRVDLVDYQGFQRAFGNRR